MDKASFSLVKSKRKTIHLILLSLFTELVLNRFMVCIEWVFLVYPVRGHFLCTGWMFLMRLPLLGMLDT